MDDTIRLVEEIFDDWWTTQFDHYIFKDKENAIKKCKELWEKFLDDHERDWEIDYTNNDWWWRRTNDYSRYDVWILWKHILDFNKL